MVIKFTQVLQVISKGAAKHSDDWTVHQILL